MTEDWSKISPNALLRPVFQEKVLPNIAYIGGNAEIMYWLEMPKVFEKFGVEFPLLVPRNSMLFLRKKTLDKIEKSGVALQDFLGDFQKFLNQKLLKESELNADLESREQLLKENFEILKNKASLTAVTFRNMVEAEETRQLKSFQKFKKRLLRAEKILHADKIDYLQRLYSEIHPANNWQERSLNFSVFFAENGEKWLENCYQEMEVLNSVLIVSEF